MKLRSGRENSVKKAIFWQFWASQCTRLKKFDCVQMNFYVEFLDTCYEIIRKPKVPKRVIFWPKSETSCASLFLDRFQKFQRI